MSFSLNRSMYDETLGILQSTSASLPNNTEFVNWTSNVEFYVDDYQLPKALLASVLASYVILFILSCLGNGVVCLAIGFRYLKPTVTNFFMCSLAASDVLVTVLSVPFTVLSNLVFMYWPFGPFLCPVISLLQLMVNMLRALTLVAMTCDRYFVITKPFSQRLTLKQAKLVIAGIWSFSLVFSLPVAIFSKIIYLPHEPGSKGLCFEVWTNESLRRVYGITIMLIQYFIPLLLMFLTFSHIALIVWTKRAPGEANKKRDERRGRSKKRMLQMLIIIVLNYFLSWLPYHVISIVGDVHPSIYDSKSMHILWALSHLLSISNSATNSGIYYWRNRNYRLAFQNLWKTCIQCRCTFGKDTNRYNNVSLMLSQPISRRSSSILKFSRHSPANMTL